MSALEALNAASQRYVPVSEIGRGAFSVVVSASDRVTSKKVAIKRITHVFDDAVFAKHVLREIKMLRHLKHPNVISMQDIILEPPSSHGAHKWIPDPKIPGCPAIGSGVTAEQRIYFVSEQMDTDLHAVIQSPQPLSVKHLQYFMYQLLQGVAYLHRANVLHRDLKPENILVNRDCHLKVCDLGLARFDKHAHAYPANWSPFSLPASPSTNSCASSNSDRSTCFGSPQSVKSAYSTASETEGASGMTEEDFAMTERVVTRWYRAPEVILSMGKYSCALDMWSVACIFAELAGRRPLFPGKDFMEQLHLISGVLGKPTEHEINFFESPKAREFLRALPEKKPVPLSTLFSTLDSNGLDLLSKMLVFDPRKRLTAEEALRHPFFASLYRPDDCLAAPSIAQMQGSFAFELNPSLELPVLRDAILQEMRELLTVGNPASPTVQAISANSARRRSDVEGNAMNNTEARLRKSEGECSNSREKKLEGDAQRIMSSYPNLPPLPPTGFMDVDKAPKSERSRLNNGLQKSEAYHNPVTAMVSENY